MKKLLGIILVLVMAVSLFSGCGKKEEETTTTTETTTTDTEAPAEKLIVGYANLDDTDEFAMMRLNALMAAVDEAGLTDKIEFVRADAAGDITKQLAQIDNFITQKVDAVIVVPVDYSGIVPGIEALNNAGVPAITLVIEAESGDVCAVGSPNYDAGLMQAEYLAEKLPENAKVLYLEGISGMYHSVERLDGINQLLEMRPDVQIVESLAADYDKAKGMAKMEDWLQKYPNADDFQAVAAANDMMALGALEAMKVGGRLEGIMVLGIDGLPVALDAIDAGEMTMSVFQKRSCSRCCCTGCFRISDGWKWIARRHRCTI